MSRENIPAMDEVFEAELNRLAEIGMDNMGYVETKPRKTEYPSWVEELQQKVFKLKNKLNEEKAEGGMPPITI